MKASVAQSTFISHGLEGVVQVVAVDFCISVDGKALCSALSPHHPHPAPADVNFRLISISIAVASFSLLRHAPQVAEVTQGEEGVGWCGKKKEGGGRRGRGSKGGYRLKECNCLPGLIVCISHGTRCQSNSCPNQVYTVRLP